jgi:hypothetical protein
MDIVTPLIGNINTAVDIAPIDQKNNTEGSGNSLSIYNNPCSPQTTTVNFVLHKHPGIRPLTTTNLNN